MVGTTAVFLVLSEKIAPGTARRLVSHGVLQPISVPRRPRPLTLRADFAGISTRNRAPDSRAAAVVSARRTTGKQGAAARGWPEATTPGPEIQSLVDAARAAQGTFTLRAADFSAASVGAALRTTSGAVYTGVCVDLARGIGFCAEQSAIAEMLEHREVAIEGIVAVDDTGILAPCGRCREFMAQLSPRNAAAQIVLPDLRITTLRLLLPEHWLLR